MDPPARLNDTDHPKQGHEPLAREPFTQVDPAFSPDGRWIAYMALGGQICVRPFPSTPSARRVAVSESGAKFPVWSRNGRELFYLNSYRRIMVVRYTASGPSFNYQAPQQWSPAQIFRPTNNALSNFDMPRDDRLLVLAPPEPRSDEPNTVHATILLNFFDELRRRLPST